MGKRIVATGWSVEQYTAWRDACEQYGMKLKFDFESQFGNVYLTEYPCATHDRPLSTVLRILYDFSNRTDEKFEVFVDQMINLLCGGSYSPNSALRYDEREFFCPNLVIEVANTQTFAAVFQKSINYIQRTTNVMAAFFVKIFEVVDRTVGDVPMIAGLVSREARCKHEYFLNYLISFGTIPLTERDYNELVSAGADPENNLVGIGVEGYPACNAQGIDCYCIEIPPIVLYTRDLNGLEIDAQHLDAIGIPVSLILDLFTVQTAALTGLRRDQRID
jgi:hypothetical protein